MIGLGSNRLTVCRRGGMSVTQAGRGGMEWLAGGRRPSWASPYSAQATAALKAQFPTQWPTIQDYGFAHPEIVGFVNEMPLSAKYMAIDAPNDEYTLLSTSLSNSNVKDMVHDNANAYVLFGGTLNAGKSWGSVVDSKQMLQPNVMTQWEMYIKWSNRAGNACFGNFYAGGGYNGFGFNVASNVFQVRKGIVQNKTNISQDFVFMKRNGSKVYYSTDRANWIELISIESINPTGISVSGPNGSWGQSSLYTNFPVDLTMIIATPN